MTVWVKPSGMEIEINDRDATVAAAEANGWTRKKRTRRTKAEMKEARKAEGVEPEEEAEEGEE